jgi:hypothetical protein
MTRTYRSLFVFVFLGLNGCQSYAPPPPLPAPVMPLEEPGAGLYSGTLLSALNGVGTVQLSLRQEGTQVRGTWDTVFASPYTPPQRGSVVGQIQGERILLVYTPLASQHCPYNIIAQQVPPARLTGTFASYNCPRAESGTFDLTAP